VTIYTRKPRAFALARLLRSSDRLTLLDGNRCFRAVRRVRRHDMHARACCTQAVARKRQHSLREKVRVSQYESATVRSKTFARSDTRLPFGPRRRDGRLGARGVKTNVFPVGRASVNNNNKAAAESR